MRTIATGIYYICHFNHRADTICCKILLKNTLWLKTNLRSSRVFYAIAISL